MATRGKKKPAKRKPQGVSKTNRSLSMFGWLASAAVAGAWAISDGRPVRVATETIDHLRGKLESVGGGDRVAALIKSDAAIERPVRPVAARMPDRSREQPPVESTHPTPKPPAEIRKADPRIPLPVSAPLLPLAAPPLEMAIRQPRPLAMPSIGTEAGEQRHATRALAAHVAPDAASATVASVESGSSVSVLRRAGDWRYVRNGRSGVEGWVDGRFLAGEAMSADLATLASEDLARRR
ncbi:hypothetical protein [Aureimonas leprariae]|uniref:SH3 domain-containing protein n=1 Tax=Plantimonas leprariae TaxID=2615207 RepID=A0A7V7PR49_9HYPH|nr:hypothetical protein [Aureimonas leprariae]KAB0680909.1 hypothetical protein F6X38_07975 [Aureimonas leprariae]